MSKFFRALMFLGIIAAIVLLVLYILFSSIRVKKPVIYLYPTIEQKVSVNLDFKGQITCTYPMYKNGWNVIARPDGTLFNIENSKEYSYLFWEGTSNTIDWDLSKGFIVEGKDTAAFLERKLSEIGLSAKESNDFITYWLPEMEQNKYNLISFQEKEYLEAVKLNIDPKPDSVLRVFMVYKPLKQKINVKEQNFKPFKREGFTVVEWGGAKVR